MTNSSLSSPVSLGPVMLDLESLSLSEEETELLQHPVVGGVILFTHNYESPEQLEQLILDIRKQKPDILVAVDQEGGRVQRFRESFSWLPPSGLLGNIYDVDKKKGIECANIFAQLMASELLCYGVDFSFAPVLDIDYTHSEVIGDRALHSDVDSLIALAKAYINGLHEVGMAAIGKHFPGHGYVRADSHTDVPVDDRDYEDIYKNDMQPYFQLCAVLDGVMPAHVIYNKVDESPAGFSSYWLKTILRKTLQFNGIIFSDDLNMKAAGAISDSYSDRATAVLDAGCDMVLICNNRVAALEIVTALKNTQVNLLAQRIKRVRARKKYDISTLKTSVLWKTAQLYTKEYA